jgi:hypothetical protein
MALGPGGRYHQRCAQMSANTILFGAVKFRSNAVFPDEASVQKEKMEESAVGAAVLMGVDEAL